MSVTALVCSAATAAWSTAALRGAVSLDQALDELAAVGPVSFRFDSDDEQVALPLAIAQWRHRGITGWRYVPLAPGDVAGLPGPRGLHPLAIEAGAALVTVDGEPTVMVPVPVASATPSTVVTEFHAFAADDFGRPAHESVGEAERSLLAALADAVDTLDALDVTSWRPDVEDLRQRWEHDPPLPPGVDGRGQRLAVQAMRVLLAVELGLDDDGGSRTSHEVAERRRSLVEVARQARHAHAIAWNAGLRPDTSPR